MKDDIFLELDAQHAVHMGIWCDMCDSYPISGARYSKETSEGTYDVCQECYKQLASSKKDELSLYNDLQTPVSPVLIPNPLQQEPHHDTRVSPVFSTVGVSPVPAKKDDCDILPNIMPDMPHMELVKYRRSASLEEFIANEPDETSTVTEVWRWRIATVVESNPSRAVVVSCIIANSIIVGIYANGSIDDGVYDVMDLIFTLFFSTEISLKLFSFGFAIYFSDPW